MRVIDALSPLLKFDADYPLHLPLTEEPMDLEAIQCLADFHRVPADYVTLYAYYGPIGFEVLSTGRTFSLRHPAEAHQFYFEDGRSEVFPGMFPMMGGNAYSLYFGEVAGVTGVYATWDSSSWPEMSRFIAPSSSAMLFDGIGLELIGTF